MKFYGIVEAEPSVPFMLGHPILGAAILDNGAICLGAITGDIEDLQGGHIGPGVSGVKDFISKLHLIMSPEDVPHHYNLTLCTYKEACEKALEYYKEDTWIIESIGGGAIEFDMRLIKNKLSKVLTEA